MALKPHRTRKQTHKQSINLDRGQNISTTHLPKDFGFMIDSIEIDGVRLYLSQPDMSEGQWIGQREILQQLLACWLVVDDKDLPLSPRLVTPARNHANRLVVVT